MLSQGVDPSKAVGPKNVTALILAARYDQLKIAKLLVAGDAALDAEDSKYGSTARMVMFLGMNFTNQGTLN